MNVRPTGSNRDIIISADCRAFSPSPTSFHASNILPHLFLFTPHSMCYSFFFCLRFPPLTVGLRILFPNFRQQAGSACTCIYSLLLRCICPTTQRSHSYLLCVGVRYGERTWRICFEEFSVLAFYVNLMINWKFGIH